MQSTWRRRKRKWHGEDCRTFLRLLNFRTTRRPGGGAAPPGV